MVEPFFVVFKKQYDSSETIALKQTNESKSDVVSENSHDFWETLFGKRFKCNGKIVFLIAGVAARGQYFERNFLIDNFIPPTVKGDGFLVIEGNVSVFQKEHCRVCRCRF